LLANRRDVTTTSKEAYEVFREALENEKRFYFKEARLGFAKALELDPSFAMAMLGMARQAKSEEQAKTFIERAARERDRLTEREQYWVDIGIAGINKKADEVQRLAAELRAKYPHDGRAASILAHGAMAKGDTDRAIRIFEELLQVDPNYADAYNQIGYYHGYRGDHERSMAALRKYQFIAANEANPYDSLGENLAHAGRYPEAIENLNRALAVKPDFDPAYWHLGVVYDGMGDYAKAIESYEKAADLADNDGKRVNYLFQAMRSAAFLKDVKACERLADRIAKVPLDKQYTVGQDLWLAAVIDNVAGRPKEAEKKLRELRPILDEQAKKGIAAGHRKSDHYPGWNTLLALSLAKQGRLDEAIEQWRVNVNPPEPVRDYEDRRSIYESRASLAMLLARKGKLDEAEKLIAENRKWNPSWAPTREAEVTVAELRREKVLAASTSR
jgi:tetratricopeptide (TPR) repeat protein